jgi:hypothetical protein
MRFAAVVDNSPAPRVTWQGGHIVVEVKGQLSGAADTFAASRRRPE